MSQERIVKNERLKSKLLLEIEQSSSINFKVKLNQQLKIEKEYMENSSKMIFLEDELERKIERKVEEEIKIELA